MGAAGWRTLDEVLGFAELALVPLSLIYMTRTVRGRNRRARRRARILVGLLAVTVAQPFGVKAVSISPQQYNAGNPRPANAEAIHSIDVLGLPLFGYRPYVKSIVYLDRTTGEPSHWLKIRSWLWPGLLTNGSKIERLCGAKGEPCWVPADQRPTVLGGASNLEAVTAGGEWRYHVLTGDGQPATYPAGPPYIGQTGYFRLAIGIVSIAGVLYWLAAAVLTIASLTVFRIPSKPIPKHSDDTAT